MRFIAKERNGEARCGDGSVFLTLCFGVPSCLEDLVVNIPDLIDSLIAEGGQKVTVVVRRISNDPHHDYEVIAGTCRHWSISWLRTHSYPDMQFATHVAMLDDEVAFRLADLENRARRDVLDVARARNYAAAVMKHYDGKQKRVAERLRISGGWL